MYRPQRIEDMQSLLVFIQIVPLFPKKNVPLHRKPEKIPDEARKIFMEETVLEF